MLRAQVVRFLRDEDGAVTVDWVTLAAALVGFGTLVVLNVGQGASSLSASIGNDLSTASVSDVVVGGTQARQSSTANTGSDGTVSP